LQQPGYPKVLIIDEIGYLPPRTRQPDHDQQQEIPGLGDVLAGRITFPKRGELIATIDWIIVCK
jgi:hypothetical protein